MKRPELWSLLVFVIGLTIGITGTILAIVFGVESEHFVSDVGIARSVI